MSEAVGTMVTVESSVTVDASVTVKLSTATVTVDSPSSSFTVTAAVDSTAADLPNASERVDITAADLPLHCPLPGKRLWDSHPRVFLPIKPGGEEVCPYCGTRYVFAPPVEESPAAESAAESG